jgi:hypothetical protein
LRGSAEAEAQAARGAKRGSRSSGAPREVPELAGAKMLIVDDDIRNIYSLTSVLESYDVEVLHAERGKDGIADPRADAGHRHRADRHHDAGDGRLRDDAADPAARRSLPTCR